MNNKHTFSEWLSKKTDLATSSIDKYVSAINTISNELSEQGLLSRSIYSINNPSQVVSLKNQYLSILEFQQKDIRGNRMYSSALTYYYQFTIAKGSKSKNKTYNKLIRDRIPEIIENTGKSFKTEILSDERYIAELKKKLIEEVAEYQEAANDSDALEELADILELMNALSHQHGATIQEIERIRKEKAEKRGAFNEKIFLIEVEDD